MPGIEIIADPKLSDRTSIRLGGTAIAELCLKDIKFCEKVPGLLASLGGRPALIGAGSNIIAADGPLPLVLIRFAGLDKNPSFARNADKTLVTAPAFLPLPALLRSAAARGLSGLEGLTGIPGSVGGAVAMNAGSFGAETGALLHSLTFFSPRFGLKEIPAGEAAFYYRRADYMGLPFGGAAEALTQMTGPDQWILLLSAVFALKESAENEVLGRMRAFYARKKLSQPLTGKSAGCVFKNPAPQIPAGRLLEEAGLKGRGAGGMRFSPLHANFLINEGQGSYAAAADLMEEAVALVKKNSGLLLEKEVRVWS
ncbi:MAG: FAD-binding protein [Desulfovibrio sp.]|jgi:UDP-N-acetylmuramate dehydrogenase|nr:FAD-binding protein [Desulfovibrio sp.]